MQPPHQDASEASEMLSVSDASPSVPFVTHTEESCVSVSLKSVRTAIVLALNCFWYTNALNSTSDQFVVLKPLQWKHGWLGVNFTGKGIRRSLHTIKQHNYCFSIKNILANWDRLTSVWLKVKEQALQYSACMWQCCKHFLTLPLFNTC